LDFGVPLLTIGHGTRPAEELVETIRQAGAQTLVDVRRFPGSKRNPQFNQAVLARTLADGGITYVHAVELGGRRSGEPGEERFGCVRVAAFRSYAARMVLATWREALAAALAEPRPSFMCAETDWRRCHRRLIADFLTARGHEVIHLMKPGQAEAHALFPGGEVRDGSLYLCGELVA
jgi:uncharacterized protein (DUF488 family)